MAAIRFTDAVLVFALVIGSASLASSSDCREGFLRMWKGCYYFSEVAASWNQSIKECRDRGARLVSVDSAEEQYMLSLHIYKTTGERIVYWTSGNNLANKSVWKWESLGTPIEVTKQFWCLLEPNNDGGNENCITIRSLGCWNDAECSRTTTHILEQPIHYICESYVGPVVKPPLYAGPAV